MTLNKLKNRRSVFVRSVLLSGLAAEEHLVQAIDRLRPSSHTESFSAFEITDQQLASQLVAMGVLTSYQAAQLSQGRTKLNLGPYLVTDWIGQGGMGQVFKGIHQMMGREVAIKVLPQYKSSPEAIARFTHEIRAQAKLDHENLVRAFDAGHDGNVYFLVTEYVAGADLRRLSRSQGRLSLQQAAWIVMQAALGLDHAHRRGLIHRDVKPGNILVTREGMAKVSDLGLSGWVVGERPDVDDGRLVGTMDYLAPEQITAPDRVTPLCDIYSLGCSLYYAVTGKVPFPGGSSREKARRHCEETPWHPRRFNPELSDEFVDVIAEMMDKEPERRIPSAAEVAARLEPFVDDDMRVDFAGAMRSPWTAPSLPSGGGETATELDDRPGPESSSGEIQGESQATRHSAHAEETVAGRPSRSAPKPPPLPQEPRRPTELNTVLLTLAVSIPLSMMAGALLMLGLMWLIKQLFEG